MEDIRKPFDDQPAQDRSKSRIGTLVVVLGTVVSVALVAIGITFAVLSTDSTADNSSGSTAAPKTKQEQNRAFAQCLRDNGVPNFPDPDAKGALRVTPESGVDVGSAAYKKAEATCMQSTPPSGQQQGAPPPDGQKPVDATKYVECMRKNGQPDFPEPDERGIFTGIDLDTPEYKAAQKVCEKEMPGPPGS